MENLIKDKNELNSFLKGQIEKTYYLGEYKERILGALNKEQIMKDDIYPEIIGLMEEKEACLLKLSRDVEIKKLKPYIMHAEKIGLKYQLVDGLSYRGNIGLVVVSETELEFQSENIIIKDMAQDFIDVGLGEIFSKNKGFICSKHYRNVKEKLPNHINEFKKISLFGKFVGLKCSICEEEKEYNSR